MTEEQIKHMVSRFLSWRLPKPWNPDNGISYQRPNYMHPPADSDWPVGTNLFDAEQATAMVHYMLEGMPTVDDGRVPDRETFWLVERSTAPPQYVSLASSGWCHDVWRARRFQTERAAHDYWRLMGEIDRPQFRVVEHLFINR